MKTRFSDLQNEWVRSSVESEMGLWWLANDVREIIGNLPEEEVCSVTLEILQPLLTEKKLFPINLSADDRYTIWSDEPTVAIEKIREQWLSLGRKPKIDDIVWFIGDRKA